MLTRNESSSDEEDDDARLRRRLRSQLDELELLREVFPAKGELDVDETAARLADLYVRGEISERPPPLTIAVRTPDFELSAELSSAYPDRPASLIVRGERLSRDEQRALQRTLGGRARDAAGEPIVLSAVEWARDEIERLAPAAPTTESNAPPSPPKRARLWLHSHHIYSATKRKTMVNTARELELGGFVLPGKPGVACVEGEADACDEWWSAVKAMNWKRIVVKLREQFESDEPFERKFGTFEEIGFRPVAGRGGDDRHPDMSEFHKYLNEHGCSEIFSELFGLERHIPDER